MTVVESAARLPRRKRHNPHVEAGGAMAEIIAPLACAGRLSQRAMLAAHRFLTDLQSDAGTSGNIASCYAERVQASLRGGRDAPLGWSGAGERVQCILDQLSGYEREVLDFLIRNREYPRRGLHEWGKAKARYAESHSAAGYTVGQIAMLLERIADLYARYSVLPRV
jgi:hypothetical protein